LKRLNVFASSSNIPKGKDFKFGRWRENQSAARNERVRCEGESAPDFFSFRYRFFCLAAATIARTSAAIVGV
jgi:hypothetical protein